MSESKQIDCFIFQKEETYEAAKKEKMVIDAIRQKYDVKNKRVALKIYQKAVKDNSFSTVIGYSFLAELYHNMEQAKVPINDLPRLPLKETAEERPGKGYLPAASKAKEEKSGVGAQISIEGTTERSTAISGTEDWQKIELIFNSKDTSIIMFIHISNTSN